MNQPLSCAFQDAMTPRQTHWSIGLGFTTQDWQQASSDGGQSGDSARTTATTPPNGTASSSTHSEAGRFKHLPRGCRWRPKVLVAKGNFQVAPDAVHCRLLRLCRCVSYCELIHSIDAYWFRERWLVGDCGGATGIVAVQHDTALKLLTRANRFDDRLYQRLRLTTNCCTLYGAFVVVFH